MMLSAVAAALITVSSLLVATPAQAAGSFSLNNGHFFVAPPVVYPGLIAPVSVGLGNNSNASAATVTITFGIVCYSRVGQARKAQRRPSSSRRIRRALQEEAS